MPAEDRNPKFSLFLARYGCLTGTWTTITVGAQTEELGSYLETTPGRPAWSYASGVRGAT